MTLNSVYLAPTELFVRPSWKDGRNTISKLIAADATNFPAGFFPKGLLVCEVATGVVDPYINHAYVTLDTCQAKWDDGTNGTCALDTDTPCGTYSNKITIAAAAVAGNIVADNDFTAVNISASEFLMCWVKSSIALDAADIKLLTSDSASAASAATLTEIPAMNAGEWTYICKAIGGTPHAATISVGVELDVDKGAMDFWVADMRTADTQASAAIGMLAEDVVFSPDLRDEYGDYNGTGNFQARVVDSGEVFKDKVLGYDSAALTDIDGVLRENSTVIRF